MKKGPNVPASIHARLLTLARSRGEDFNLTLQRYLAERFLYRLGASSSRQKFVLKGAMLFALWNGSLYRPTRDLDLAGYTADGREDLVARVKEICDIRCVEDGVAFVPSTVRAEPIRDNAEYQGSRVHIGAILGTARLRLQIDIGFGDAIEPPAVDVEYPVLVPLPPPRIRAYPREAVVAEKLHAMAVLGTRNSRYKDFYDVFVLATNFPFSGAPLSRAIVATFKRRGTATESGDPAALTTAFYADSARADAWRQFLARNAIEGAPPDFAVVGERIIAFLGPLWHSIATSEIPPANWSAGGPWGSAS